MRDIEFRIYADNKFYYKCLVGNTNNIEDSEWTCPMVLLENSKWVHCDNGIIQQYTGLKDKNGKKIFEGDIVKTKLIDIVQKGKKWVSEEHYENRIVEYSQEELGFRFKNKQNQLILCIDCEHEVIGNIYENPELLEVENNE